MAKSHAIIDFYKADAQILAKTSELKAAIERACKSLDLEIIEDIFYQFEPEGVTATIKCAQMHFNIHTWPEFRSCAIDLYSSRGHDFTSQIAVALQNELKASEHDKKFMNRT